MDGLLSKGHHLFTDRFYTSIPLLMALASARTSYTGTINKTRKNLPPSLKKLKLKKGEMRAFEKDGNMILAWRDKR